MRYIESDLHNIRLAIDIGGTFTDAVLDVSGKQFSAKLPTSIEQPEQGFLDIVQHLLGVSAR